MMGRYTLAEVKTHSRYDDAWTVLNGKVYNITSYLPFHQGGEKELMRCAGRDGTRLFSKSFRSIFCVSSPPPPSLREFPFPGTDPTNPLFFVYPLE